MSEGHIFCTNKGRRVSIQYSLQLQKNDGKTKVSNIHIQKDEFYCFWVSHRYPLRKTDYYCLVCPDEPNIRIFVKTDELKTGINYLTLKDAVFSDGNKIWNYVGTMDKKIDLNDRSLKTRTRNFNIQPWKDIKWMKNRSQPLWLIKTYKNTPQEYYTKASLAQIYQDNQHWNYKYNNKRTASIAINRNSKNNKWTLIAYASTVDVEYWVIKGELNAGHDLLLESFANQ